jgi:hypothetical protein
MGSTLSRSAHAVARQATSSTFTTAFARLFRRFGASSFLCFI